MTTADARLKAAIDALHSASEACQRTSLDRGGVLGALESAILAADVAEPVQS